MELKRLINLANFNICFAIVNFICYTITENILSLIAFYINVIAVIIIYIMLDNSEFGKGA